jgi:hypothetical protein
MLNLRPGNKMKQDGLEPGIAWYCILLQSPHWLKIPELLNKGLPWTWAQLPGIDLDESISHLQQLIKLFSLGW